MLDENDKVTVSEYCYQRVYLQQTRYIQTDRQSTDSNTQYHTVHHKLADFSE